MPVFRRMAHSMYAKKCCGKREEKHTARGWNFRQTRNPVLPGMGRVWEGLRLVFDSTGPVIFAQKCAGTGSFWQLRSGSKYSRNKVLINLDTFYLYFAPAALGPAQNSGAATGVKRHLCYEGLH